MQTLPKSKLTRDQKLHWGPKIYEVDGITYAIRAVVRHDDECRNGHNSFSITGTIHEKSKNGVWRDYCRGSIHEEISEHFPELKPLIKWHLTSTDGPLHYIANTMYHVGNVAGSEVKQRNLVAARSCAVWPDATDEELTAPDLKVRLLGRLPALMAEFKTAIESLGLVY